MRTAAWIVSPSTRGRAAGTTDNAELPADDGQDDVVGRENDIILPFLAELGGNADQLGGPNLAQPWNYPVDAGEVD